MSSVNEVYDVCSGDISLWVGGGIHLKVNNPSPDPVELSDEEAIELADLLLRLAGAR